MRANEDNLGVHVEASGGLLVSAHTFLPPAAEKVVLTREGEEACPVMYGKRNIAKGIP